MVKFKYNEYSETYNVELPYSLGSLKTDRYVAKINPKDNTIKFWDELSFDDVRSIMLQWGEFKHQLDRNPLEDL